MIEISATLTDQAVARPVIRWKHVMLYVHTEANLYKSICVTVAYGTVLGSK